MKMEPELYNKLKHRLSMLFEGNRLKTFKSWQFDVNKNCSAPKLAEAGFYYTGTTEEPDAVQCFLCDKALDGWEENDDPWAEHLSHSQSCKFAQVGQPEEALSLSQMMDLHLQLINKECTKTANSIRVARENDFNMEYLKMKRSLNGLKKC